MILEGIQASCGLTQWLSGKEPVFNVGDTGDVGLIPGSGRSPGEVHGNPHRYSCLENPMDRGAWWATAYGVTKEPDMTEFARMHSGVRGMCFLRVVYLKKYD